MPFGRKPSSTNIAPAPPPKLPANARVLPSASEISRVLEARLLEEQYVIQATDVIEEAFPHLQCRSGLIYVHGGDSNGVLAQTSGATTYLGSSAKYLTEYRNQGEQNVPYVIAEHVDSSPQEARVFVRGTAGDKLLLRYRPA
jgi:hypothetical protein